MADIQTKVTVIEGRRHQLLANIVFLAHVTFGLWLLVGWLFVEWQLLYIASLLIWIGSWLVFGLCPLTYVEFSLRRKAGVEIDTEEEFIHHYAKKFFRIDLPMSVIFIAGIVTFFILFTLSQLNKSLW